MKCNTKARALTEFEKAEEKSKARTVDRAKPNEPEISSAQVAVVSSLTAPTRVLGSIKRREAWKC